jgi:hypothetical protein
MVRSRVASDAKVTLGHKGLGRKFFDKAQEIDIANRHAAPLAASTEGAIGRSFLAPRPEKLGSLGLLTPPYAFGGGICLAEPRSVGHVTPEPDLGRRDTHEDQISD